VTNNNDSKAICDMLRRTKSIFTHEWIYCYIWQRLSHRFRNEKTVLILKIVCKLYINPYFSCQQKLILLKMKFIHFE
jgi:hypothetical protein